MAAQTTHPSRAIKLVDGAGWEGRRKHQRKPVLWSARLETADSEYECIAYNLSLGGAKLRLVAPLPLHRPVRLVLERFDCALAGETVWRRAGTLGVRFTDPPERVAKLLGSALGL